MKTISGLDPLLKARALMESKINPSTADERRKESRILFYTITEKCEQGTILHVEASSHCPEFFICNPLDFDEINEKITGRKLVSVDSYLVRMRT